MTTSHPAFANLDSTAGLDGSEDQLAVDRAAVSNLLRHCLERMLLLEHAPGSPWAATWAQELAARRESLAELIERAPGLRGYAEADLPAAQERAVAVLRRLHQVRNDVPRVATAGKGRRLNEVLGRVEGGAERRPGA